VEYAYLGAKERLASDELAEDFISLHREMAVLRIVAAGQNVRLSGGARIKPTSKDHILRDDTTKGS
jgi:hypothetical protein